MVIVQVQHLCCTCVCQGETPCQLCAISFSSFPATCNVMSCVFQTFIFTQIFEFLLQVHIMITTQPRVHVLACSSCSCSTKKCARNSEYRKSAKAMTSEMQQHSPLEKECLNKFYQEERIAAAEDAASAEADQLQEIALLTKESVNTKRKLGHVTEDLEVSCRDNDKLRKRDLGLFYPKMDYMGLQMPGEPDDISIGQHLSEKSEVILLCKYFH